jgi:uncharacterized SAM-binding protein YcdF (DUF218 family)
MYSIAFLVVVWLIGFGLFLFNLPKDTCTNHSVDAVVVLTGGKNRIEEALKLFSKNKAKKILISGVGNGVIKRDFLDLFTKHHVSQDQIILGNLAQDTLGNAIESKIFIKLHGYTSLCLVTSSYHLPRSSKIFKHLMPEITLFIHPVFSENFKRDNYSNRLSSLSIGFLEYNKYWVTIISYMFEYLTEKYYHFLEENLAYI